jgi:uncharacterized membrane protein
LPAWQLDYTGKMTHPLKLICVISLAGLLLCQLGLFLWQKDPINLYWILLLSLPLLFPIKGLIENRRYTYKWIGFLTLFYFCVGISELVTNPDLKIYALLTISFSTVLFIASIYYSRYLSVTS